MAKITEKRLYAVSPRAFTSDGGANGQITVAETSDFVVGHVVQLRSSTQQVLELKVKRIVDKFTLFVGEVKQPIHNRVNISAFTVADGATIEAIEQLRPSITEQEVERNTYDEEPLVARRVRLIDVYGDDANSPISSVQGDEPIAKFIYGPALEVTSIIEYVPGAVVGDILKETKFTYGPALEVVKIETIHRKALAGDLL